MSSNSAFSYDKVFKCVIYIIDKEIQITHFSFSNKTYKNHKNVSLTDDNKGEKSNESESMRKLSTVHK